ncbi:class I SAM-dependent methyltransferase [Bradyrhizobium sp. CCGB12]|uniref:class I SAM-dependent methyltransferase n=1 Tax=Bradyrhizobium sp. CCGB12 TaxID=2949632 RepID=UPI0020B3BCFF|nr:class I SAM-dependent methyltransferase [Bradyrhizobium sp. CCGB12]MCP3391901.1 class I SAM-dependent methyltransferase [Bradyrhizobium sp. CCGB12]
MDLRKFLRGDIDTASRVLDYQPFILSDDIETGAAYSWLRGSDPRTEPALVLRRKEMDPADWRIAVDTNARLRAMYEDILDEIAVRFPGQTLLDVACNNGYFPVGAEIRGMRATGIDLGNYGPAVQLLNDALGTQARFIHASYNSRTHELPDIGQFDVTVMSAIMCHLPDPLYFLAAVGKATKRALIFWGQLVETERLLISYQPPHPNLSSLPDFPHSFNDNTRISAGMFKEATRQMGFRDVIEIKPKPTWLTQLVVPRGIPLESELGTEGSRHVALIAVR